MPELQLLRADHGVAVLAFEMANRAWFTRSVSDRGEEFFERFDEVHAARLAEQAAGLGAYYVLVEQDGSVVGRVNLILSGDGSATLGYRIAEAAAGRGLATAAVHELCGLAAARHGVHRIVASTSRQNAASRKVLANAGFVLVGPADPADLGGKAGDRFERLLQPV